MSNHWNDGYFTAVDYVHGYYKELNPTWQRFCLLASGHMPLPTGADSAHCELGFGQGNTINLHAAATPALFVGTDFTPSQAANAQDMARACDSGARLYDDSFEQLLSRTDLPQFDSISLHGIWTWVSQENRNFIIEFARRHLKPGGVLYVSYNALPGWGPYTPMRDLMLLRDDYARHFHHDPAAPQASPNGQAPANSHSRRIGASLDFTLAAIHASHEWRTHSPALQERFDSIKDRDRTYLAHEYFNRAWDCMYFADVVDALAPAKLEFACSALPSNDAHHLGYNLHMPAVIRDIAHPVLREQARDFVRFGTFRKDLFMRGARRLHMREQRKLLLVDMHFVLLTTPQQGMEKIRDIAGIDEELCAAVMEHLASHRYTPKPLAQCAIRLEESRGRLHVGTFIEHLQTLAAQDIIAPCQSESDAQKTQARCARLNHWLGEQISLADPYSSLASPVLGGGIMLNNVERMLTHAVRLGGKTPQDIAARAYAMLEHKSEVLLKDGQRLTTPAENQAHMLQHATTFIQERLPILRALQVV